MQNLSEASSGRQARDKQARAAASGGLRTPGLLGRNPWIGVGMVFLGILFFILIASSLKTNGFFVQSDVSIANSLHQAALQNGSFARLVMIAGYYVGEHVIAAIGVILGLYFLRKRYWPELTMVAVAWAGETLIWYSLSSTFDRSRPVFSVPVWHQMTAPGFPSGHMISAVMCYGLLAYLVVPKTESAWAKIAIILASILAIFWVGYSRIYLGDHYLSDVLAGLALGVAWSGLVYTGVELIFLRRKKKNVWEK
jgi:membrane-associated phospholipid phosphatase